MRQAGSRVLHIMIDFDSLSVGLSIGLGLYLTPSLPMGRDGTYDVCHAGDDFRPFQAKVWTHHSLRTDRLLPLAMRADVEVTMSTFVALSIQ